MIMKPIPMDPELEALIEKAREWYRNATPKQREAMMHGQRESWVRGEMAFGSDADEAEFRRRMEILKESP
jgi:hypothetical protein